MPTPHNARRCAKHRRLTNRDLTRDDDGDDPDGRDHEHALTKAQIQRWLDDGGAGQPERREIRTRPCVWAPTALKARLAAEHALAGLPRQPWGYYAAARSALARIVAQVELRILAQNAAAERLRQLTISLELHGRSREAMPRN